MIERAAESFIEVRSNTRNSDKFCIQIYGMAFIACWFAERILHVPDDLINIAVDIARADRFVN